MNNSGSRRSLGPRYRTPEAAKYLGIAPSTLEKMRCTGTGPEFERASKRVVVYSEEALEAHLALTRARSTSEASNLTAGPGRRKRKHDPRADAGANEESKPVDQHEENADTRERSADAGAR